MEKLDNRDKLTLNRKLKMFVCLLLEIKNNYIEDIYNFQDDDKMRLDAIDQICSELNNIKICIEENYEEINKQINLMSKSSTDFIRSLYAINNIMQSIKINLN